MSLIYFHIGLISIATLFGVAVGFWELNAYAKSAKVVDLAAGIGFFVIAAGLAIYLIWFIQKKKPGMTQ